MATRLIGTDSTNPRLPAGVIVATQGTTHDDLAPGDLPALEANAAENAANAYTDDKLIEAKAYTDAQIAELVIDPVEIIFADEAQTIAGTADNLAVTPAGLNYLTNTFDVRTYGAKGDNLADDTSPIQTAINAANAAGGGTVVLPAGLYRITATLQMKSYVSLQGDWPRYGSVTPDQRGTWLLWDGPGPGTETMLVIGHRAQTDWVTGVNIVKIGFDGQLASTVTCISIGSNTRTSASYLTSGVAIEKCVIAKAGVGIQWGSGETQEQADFIRIVQTDFYNLTSAGIRVNGTNCGDASTVDTCKFSNCASAGDPYIDLIMSGYMTFINCSGGGDGTNGKDFLRRGSNTNKTVLRACQSEKMRYFIRHTGTDYTNPIELHGCFVDDGISIESLGLVYSHNSKIRGPVNLTGACRWFGFDDIIVDTAGGRFIMGASAQHTNYVHAPASLYCVYAKGDRTVGATPANPFGPLETLCIRSGRVSPTWAASTAYSGVVAKSWQASTAYAVNALITPSWGNGRRYKCTVAGTSGATEPDFRWTGTFTDGTVEWTFDANTTSTTSTSYVLPTVDNAHIYKLVTAGTSAGTEPSWPLTAGATVNDGTCVWQETGPSALLRPTASLSEDSGTAAPTTGWFPRGHIRWHSSPGASGNIGWVCVAAGNPGSWRTFGAIAA